MSLRRALSRSIGAALATATAIALPLPAAAAPAYTLQERAQAIAQPAVVFLESRVSGVIRNKADGKELSDHQTTVSVRCSGFVVNPSGVAVTIRSCVAPTQTQLDAWAFETFANQQVADKKIGEDQRASYQAQLHQTATFSGESAEQPPSATLFAQMNVATAGATAAPAWPAEVLVPVDSETGLAVVKIAQSNLPAVEVNANAQVGTVQTPVAVGYVAVDTKTLTVRSRPVNVSGPYDHGPDTTHKLDAALGWESRGGLVADLDGRAVGVTMPDIDGQINVVNDATAISAELARLGVKSELGKNDLRYRQAVDLYYGGKYADAIDAFDEVIKASPANQTAVAFRKQAQDRQEIEGGSSGLPVWLIVLLSVLGTAAIVAVAAMFILRQRRTANHHPDNLNPVSLNPFASPVSGPAIRSRRWLPGQCLGHAGVIAAADRRDAGRAAERSRATSAYSPRGGTGRTSGADAGAGAGRAYPAGAARDRSGVTGRDGLRAAAHPGRAGAPGPAGRADTDVGSAGGRRALLRVARGRHAVQLVGGDQPLGTAAQLNSAETPGPITGPAFL